jgi:hypothetical protein
LRKDSTVLEFYRNKLVAEAFQIIRLQTLQALRLPVSATKMNPARTP